MEEIASPMVAAAQFAYVGSNSRAQIVDGTPVADPVGITVFAVDPATGALSSDPDRVQRHRLLFRLRCRSDASLCGQRDRRLRWRHERLGRSLCPRSRNRHAHLPQPGRFRRWRFGPTDRFSQRQLALDRQLWRPERHRAPDRTRWLSRRSCCRGQARGHRAKHCPARPVASALRGLRSGRQLCGRRRSRHRQCRDLRIERRNR